MKQCDVLILGAGIVGVSTALQLQKRGLSVILTDRHNPGEETSYGNSGVIGGPSVYPVTFPRNARKLVRIALNRSTAARYNPVFLPYIAGWLVAHYRSSAPERLEYVARAMHPLMSRALSEHESFMESAGALGYLRRNGWISLYRQSASYDAVKPALDLGREMGRVFSVLDTAEACRLEPALNPVFKQAVHSQDIASVSNPLGVTRAYSDHFCKGGGTFLVADARSLKRQKSGWHLESEDGPITANEVVVALGPWASELLAPLGLQLPLAVQRGYHNHFATDSSANLQHPVLDADIGYVISPMEQGLRLTTGVEFDRRDARPTPVQIERLLPEAHRLLELGPAIEKQPWLGARPCFPDTMPVIGPAPKLPGLWLAYGHGHMGLTLGPITGRLLAETMLGETPFTDPTPYRAERFLN
ncbi:MAG: NAD(P)/FAD-dependent oxidoreductase [Pseudomonadota bacterium]